MQTKASNRPRLKTQKHSSATHSARGKSDLAVNGGPKAVTNKLKGWPNFDESAHPRR